MKTIYVILVAIISFPIVIHAQHESQSSRSIEPILINRSALSGTGLKQIDQPNDPGKQFYQRKIFWGDELGVFVVSTNSYTNKMVAFPFDEYVYMLHGEAHIRPKSGDEQKFQSREHFFAPKGYTGEWEILAGDNLHYELSIITTKRADTSKISNTAKHILVDPSLLSGVDITFDEQDKYKQEVVAGPELSIAIHAEKPKSYSINNAKEKVIHVLSGEITITTVNSNQTFHTGDFFVVPNGLDGNWQSKGHSLVKYLCIERSW